VSDLVVVGAGTMGAWTAWHAVRAGRATTLLDAYGAGHPRATSGDETRLIRSSHGPDELYTRWSRESRKDWIALGDELGERFLVDTGALWFGHREDGFEAASEATLGRAGIPIERLSSDEVTARWPQISTDELAFATWEPEAGVLMARRGIAALAGDVKRRGGRFDLAPVRPGRRDGARLVDVTTADGRRFGGDDFVFACGPWLPRLFPDVLGDLIRVTKQDVLFMGPPGGDNRFLPGALPAWVDYDASYYGIPAIDGRGMKVAADRYGPVFDPTDGDRIVDPESVRLARGYAALRFPALAGQPVVETRVCQYETTPDTHFVIDRHPELENVWLVGGGSGHAFKQGPMIGRHVLGRIDGRAPVDGEERFGLAKPRTTSLGMRTGGDSIVATWKSV
jgi:sarcosine oxidase